LSVSGSATIESVYDSATIESVYDSATIEYVSDSATIESVYGSATIKYVYGSATIESVSGSATIKYVSGSATIESVYDSATIKSVYDSATIESVSGSATIESVYDSATIKYVYDSATIKSVSDSATIKSVSGSATIKSVSDSATIKSVSMNSILRIFSENVKVYEAVQESILIYQGCINKPIKVEKSVSIINTKQVDFSIRNFIKIYNIKKKGQKIFLYKFVSENYTDFYTGKIKYEIGKIIKCPDWNSDSNHECGGGLHLGATAFYAKFFNKDNGGHLLECEVKLNDIVIHPKPQYPFKVRVKELKVLRELKEGESK
jgi:hypothetical protein